jgi:hypothetical protein
MTKVESLQARRTVDRRIGMLMAFVAATLAVGAFVHLAGYTPAGSKPPFDASHAGVAEAIIGVVLASAASPSCGPAAEHGRSPSPRPALRSLAFSSA